MVAKSLHSYSDTLFCILGEFKPKFVFEWGPGVSTQMMAMFESVEMVVSVEHDINFYNKLKEWKFENIQFHFKPEMDDYVSAIGDARYDMVFVDGRDRSRCLECASKLTDLVILHDAARQDYRYAVNQFSYQIWTDEGNTAILTNSFDVYERAKNCLGKMVCATPKPEKVAMVGHSAEKGEVF